MNNMSAKSIPLVDTPVPDQRSGSLESSLDNFQRKGETFPPPLPRSAWNSQLAYLRVILKAKLALDRIEKEAMEES
jgi:hypothetical protein